MWSESWTESKGAFAILGCHENHSGCHENSAFQHMEVGAGPAGVSLSNPPNWFPNRHPSRQLKDTCASSRVPVMGFQSPSSGHPLTQMWLVTWNLLVCFFLILTASLWNRLPEAVSTEIVFDVFSRSALMQCHLQKLWEGYSFQCQGKFPPISATWGVQMAPFTAYTWITHWSIFLWKLDFFLSQKKMSLPGMLLVGECFSLVYKGKEYHMVYSVSYV